MLQASDLWGLLMDWLFNNVNAYLPNGRHMQAAMRLEQSLQTSEGRLWLHAVVWVY